MDEKSNRITAREHRDALAEVLDAFAENVEHKRHLSAQLRGMARAVRLGQVNNLVADFSDGDESALIASAVSRATRRNWTR